MQTCTKCFTEYPDRDFITYNKPHEECKKCIARARAKKGMQELRDRTKYVNRLQKAEKRLTDRVATQGATYQNKRALSALKRAVSVHKQRIKVMERNLTPSTKTLIAIQVRKSIVARYTQAYEEQLRMIAAGVEPSNLHDMVVELA